MERSVVLRAVGIALILLGAAGLAIAFATGEAKVALVLIIPVIYGTGALAALGILLIFGGIALLSLSFFAGAPPQKKPEQEAERESSKPEYGGVILIGPIPIVFGSARSLSGSKILLILAMLSLIALILYLVLILW